eukprot:762277-Amorphochlora_amoeboformis.AAC.1
MESDESEASSGSEYSEEEGNEVSNFLAEAAGIHLKQPSEKIAENTSTQSAGEGEGGVGLGFNLRHVWQTQMCICPLPLYMLSWTARSHLTFI